MLRAALLAAVLLAGCQDPEILPDGVSCEESSWVRESAPGHDLDLVIVVSDAASMAPYRERVLDNLETFGVLLDQSGASLHVALVDAGGLTIGDGCAPTTTDPFLSDLRQPWWSCPEDDPFCRVKNFDGELRDLLPCAAPVDNPVSAPSLIQEVANVLSGDDTGFVRPDGWLGVIVISADDDRSAQPVPIYMDRIRSSRTHPEKMWAMTITGPGATRLTDFRAAFAESATIAIDEPDWQMAVYLAKVWETLAASCLDPDAIIDLDDDQPGIQGDCIADDHGAALPYCRMATPERPDPDVLPCYWLRYDPSIIDCTEAVVERLKMLDGSAGEANLRCACAL